MTETIRNHRYNPCKGCPDRYYACSDHCEKPEFLKWKEEQARIRKARQSYQQPAWATNETDPANYRKRKKAKKPLSRRVIGGIPKRPSCVPVALYK